MRNRYEEPECEVVLMVDAENAFNNINRKATIHNIEVKCPSLAQYIKNTYSSPAELYVSDRLTNTCEVISSADPVAMAMYAIGFLRPQTLINYTDTDVKQMAYADDLTGAGKVVDIRKWWDLIETHGLPQGYFPNAAKAREAFRETNVIIKAGGEKHLGAVLGITIDREEYVSRLVEEWVKEVKALAKITDVETHCIYSFYHWRQVEVEFLDADCAKR